MSTVAESEPELDPASLTSTADRIARRLMAAHYDDGWPVWAPADASHDDVAVWDRAHGNHWAAAFAVGACWLISQRSPSTLAEAKAAMRNLPVPPPKVTGFSAFVSWFGAGVGSSITKDPEAGTRTVAAARAMQSRARHDNAVLALDAETARADGQLNHYIDSVGPTISLLAEAARIECDTELQDLAADHGLWSPDVLRRPDGSMSQVITLDTSDWEIKDIRTGEQGLSAHSTWSRSQAWGLLAAATGAARCPHRHGEFLLHAHAIAGYWIERCGLAGSPLPRWDFDAPTGPIDTSAAAIAATALLRLAAIIEPRSSRQAVRYRHAAERTLAELCQRVTPTSPDDRRPPGMLLDGCYHYPQGLAIADELVWGDYYLLEACVTALGELDTRRL